MKIQWSVSSPSQNEQFNPLHAIREVFFVGGRSLTNESGVEVLEGTGQGTAGTDGPKSCGTGIPHRRRRPASAPHSASFYIPYILRVPEKPFFDFSICPQKDSVSARMMAQDIAPSREQAASWTKKRLKYKVDPDRIMLL